MKNRTSRHTAESIARQKELNRKKKQAEDLASAERLYKNSRIFFKAPGIILKTLCIIGIIFSIVYIYDTYSEVTFTEFETFGAKKETVKLIGRGEFIPSTWYHVDLNEEGSFQVFMYAREYEVILDSGKIEIGHTSLFHKPYFFKVTNNSLRYTKPIGYSYMYTVLYPLILFLLCLSWLFMRPDKSHPVTIYGYVLIFVIPLLLFLMSHKAIQEYNFTGYHSMPINSIELKH